MIARLRSLLVKELLHHGALLLGVGMLMAMGFALILLATLAAPATVSYLEVHTTFVRTLLVPFAFALGNRLIVAEAHGRTQRFVEALPIPRHEFHTVKWMLGAGLLLAVGVGSVLVTLAIASTREPIELSLVTSVVSRTVVFVLTLWSFLFVMGLLGKARIPLYVLLSLVLLVLAESTELELMRWGPLALVGPDLALSRAGVPVREVLVSLAIAAMCLLASALLLSVREGGIQESLGKALTARERAMVGIAMITVLTVWMSLEAEHEPAPYVMVGEHVLTSNTPNLAIAYAAATHRAEAEQMRDRLAPSLRRLAGALGVELPPSRLVLRPGFDAVTFDLPHLRNGDGSLVRANFLSEGGATADDVEAALVGAALDALSGHRATFEPQHWLRDGFALWWALCSTANGECQLPPSRRARARLLTTRDGFGGHVLERWHTTREHAGAATASDLALLAVESLARTVGRDAPARLAAARFTPGAPRDSRATWRMLRNPPESTLRALGRTSLGELAAAAATLVGDAPIWPSPQVTATFAPGATSAHDLVLELDALPDGVSTLVVRSRILGPLDVEVEPHELREQRIPAATVARLPSFAASGERVLILVDAPAPDGGAPIRWFAARVEVP